MRLLLILALCTTTTLGLVPKEHYERAYEKHQKEQYPNAEVAQKGRNFAENPVTKLDGPGCNIDNKFVPGVNPCDPARHNPGYFPNYSNSHLDNLIPDTLTRLNPARTLVSSYSVDSGNVVVDRSTSVASGRSNDPQNVYTKTSHNVYGYDGKNGPGLTETDTTVKYVPVARDVSTYSQTYPGGKVVVTSNVPARNDGRNQNRDNDNIDQTGYNTRSSTAQNGYNNANTHNVNPIDQTGTHNTRSHTAQNGYNNNGYPQNVYTKKTKNTSVYDGQNGPSVVDTDTTINYVPSNRKVTVQTVPYDGGKAVITKNKPVNSYNTRSNYQPGDVYNQAGQANRQYDTRSYQTGQQPTANQASHNQRYDTRSTQTPNQAPAYPPYNPRDYQTPNQASDTQTGQQPIAPNQGPSTPRYNLRN